MNFKMIMALLVFSISTSSWATCRTEQTKGTDRFKAKYYCEVTLRGEVTDCRAYPGTGMYVCDCEIGCNGSSDGGDEIKKVQGTDYFKAKYNCEVVLNGEASNCTAYPGTGMYTCDCRI